MFQIFSDIVENEFKFNELKIKFYKNLHYFDQNEENRNSIN